MKIQNILLLIIIIIIFFTKCECNLIESLYFNQENTDQLIQDIGVLSDNCKLPDISPTRKYACTQINDSCFDISVYQKDIDQMNSILEKDKREINLIGYLGGGPWGVPIDPYRFMNTDCDTYPDRCVKILPKIQDIPHYNTIILCYANFVGDANNPSIDITGQFNVNGIYYYKYTYPLMSDCYKCSNCSPKNCKDYCSQYNHCGNTPDHKEGIDCTVCDYKQPINKFGVDKNSQEFIDNIKVWKSVDEYSYKGPKRKVLMTFGGSANQMPQNLLKGDPNSPDSYTYNLLKKQKELDNKSIIMSFLDTWNLDGIDLDYEFSGNLSGNADDNTETGVKNNWRHIIKHLKQNKKVVYATPYGKSTGTLQLQYNYLLNKNYMGEGNTIDVMQHQMYNGGVNWNSDSNWYFYLEQVMKDILQYNTNLTLESFGSIFTNYSEDRSGNCWDLIDYIVQIIKQINDNSGGKYITNHGAFMIEYDNYYGYYFGNLIDSIRKYKIKPKPKPKPKPCIKSGKSCGLITNRKNCCAGLECFFPPPLSPFAPPESGICQKK